MIYSFPTYRPTKSVVLLWLLFIIVTTLVSCAGYKFKKHHNPFEQYNISSLHIPMFFNKSSIPNTAPAFTKEIFLTLSHFPELKVFSGEGRDVKTDAILIGIIESPPSIKNALAPSGQYEISSPKRRDFFVPNVNSINLTLRLILIKDPTHQEIEIMHTDLGKFIHQNPKIIFNEVLNASGSFSRDFVTTTQGEGPAKATSFTKNKGSLEKQIQDIAKSVARNFQESILYAY